MADIELSRMTIGDVLDRQSERFGDAEFIAYPDREERYTFRRFRERVDLAARGLMTMGVRKAEHVALWAPNLPEWLLVQYAAARIGATLVPVPTGCRATELEFILRQGEATTLIFGADATSAAIVREMLPDAGEAPVGHGHFERLPRLARLVSIGRDRQPGMLRFDDFYDLGAQTNAEDLRRRAGALDSFDVIMLAFTSGTTDYPKGAMLTHRSILVAAAALTNGTRTETDRLCVPVPFAACLGSIGGSIGCLVRGACIVPVETFEPHATFEAIAKERCTALLAMPSMLAAMLADPEADRFDRSSLRKGAVGGAPVGVDLAREASRRLGMPELVIGYGLTETSAAVTRGSPDDPPERRFGAVGRALPGVHIRVVDPRTQEPVAAGVAGELCCRGLGVMKGYYRDPESTAAAIDAEGWFHTGDLAVLDAQGYVNIVGRLRDMIVHDGEKIQPREIETLLYSHPKIADVHVIGVPNRASGEDVCAVVISRSGETIDLAQIQEFCRGRVQDAKIPSLVMIVRDFPLTASGKISKRGLRQAAIEFFGRQEDAAIVTA